MRQKTYRNLKQQNYQKNGLDKYGNLVKNFQIKKENFFWYDLECLKKFKEYGVNKFKWLDIWDIDWEEKRQTAIEKGHKLEIPDFRN